VTDPRQTERRQSDKARPFSHGVQLVDAILAEVRGHLKSTHRCDIVFYSARVTVMWSMTRDATTGSAAHVDTVTWSTAPAPYV